MKTLFLTLLISISMFNLFGQKPNDPKKTQFKFKDPETKACIVCEHVFSKNRPILYVAHDNDGDWQFMCGYDDHTEENAKVISLKQVTELDQSVNDLYEMPLNFGAERKSIKDKWVPFKFQD